MSDNNLWYGYLDAGEKSSPVLMDQRMSTANPNTVYVFNLKRSEIIEYRRDIVEPKLRELGDDEAAFTKELKSAYNKARSSFVPRGAKLSTIPEKGGPAPAPKKTSPIDSDDEEFDEIAVTEGDDEDEWEDEED
jgi:hypothetical protein